MRRRTLLFTLAGLRAAWAGSGRVRGRLIQEAGRPPAISTPNGVVELEGDPETVAVLRDARLRNADFEALGQTAAAGRFQIDPIHNRALFVYQDGKRMVITYWCDICSIRTYSPGKCVCCQEETQLDPRDPALKDADPARSSTKTATIAG